MVTICLKTNQERLIKNLKHAFNPRSMLGELLQNARRAGASHIDIEATNRSLMVTDDGSGIDDMQSLIHIGESGWDNELQQRENTFGMGVLSTLYFSDCIMVHSGTQRFSAATSEIINGKAIMVSSEPQRLGTRIWLYGVKSPQPAISLPDWVELELVYLCQAFPVRVSLNGKDLPRPLADPALVWRETPVGEVLIDLRAPSAHQRFFLQGLPLAYPAYFHQNQMVRLHDDMLVRLPDRQYLLDEEIDSPRIREAVNQAYRQALLDEKARLAPEEFIGRYGNTCLSSSNADLLNDIHFALCSWFRNWNIEPPGYSSAWEYNFTNEIVTEEVIIKEGVWCTTNAASDSEEHLTETYICSRGGYLLQERRLDSNHWLKQLERSVAPDEVVITYGNCLHTDRTPGLLDECAELMLVDTLNIGLHNESKAYPVSAVRKVDTIYLTDKAHAATRFVSDYNIDDVYQEALHDSDEQTISIFIAVGKSSKPEQVVQALLGALCDRPQPKLGGVKVQLVFDAEGRLQNVTD
ncbi:ATP-binding protein [Serratia fonticola]|uniref:ATP-binding protein n=1 Tax=Serratia fonticola TaxID=47917 RepID=UPI00192B3548|nr:ATP-binding protein [Serratia fonticola]MBL5862116.1 ATP-binding protein [Serratia fonticola]